MRNISAVAGADLWGLLQICSSWPDIEPWSASGASRPFRLERPVIWWIICHSSHLIKCGIRSAFGARGMIFLYICLSVGNQNNAPSISKIKSGGFMFTMWALCWWHLLLHKHNAIRKLIFCLHAVSRPQSMSSFFWNHSVYWKCQIHLGGLCNE